MFEIGFSSLIAFILIAITVGLMDESRVDKMIVYVTAAVGYGGLAVGFILASLKYLFFV